MIKTYVVDTNVLIQAPYALNCFEDNQVVIPVVVLEELDNLKKADGERGANARKAIRILEELRQTGHQTAGTAQSLRRSFRRGQASRRRDAPDREKFCRCEAAQGSSR